MLDLKLQGWSDVARIKMLIAASAGYSGLLVPVVNVAPCNGTSRVTDFKGGTLNSSPSSKFNLTLSFEV